MGCFISVWPRFPHLENGLKKVSTPLEGCCTSEVSGCTQNTGHVGCCKHTVLIIYREAKQRGQEQGHLPTVTQVSPLGGRKTQAQTPSHCVHPILGSGSNLPLLKCKSKTPLYPQPGLSPWGSLSLSHTNGFTLCLSLLPPSASTPLSPLHVLFSPEVARHPL